MKALIDKLVLIGEKIDQVCKVILGIQLIILTIIIVTQIVLRIFGLTIGWATEFATLFFVWATMLGSAVASRYMLHIGVDTITDRLKGNVRKAVMIIAHAIFAAGLVIFIISSVEYTLGQATHYMATLPPVSLAWFYCSLPICGVIMLYFTCIQLVEIFLYGDARRIALEEDDV